VETFPIVQAGDSLSPSLFVEGRVGFFMAGDPPNSRIGLV